MNSFMHVYIKSTNYGIKTSVWVESSGFKMRIKKEGTCGHEHWVLRGN